MRTSLLRIGRALGACALAATAVAVGGAVQAGPAAAATGWEVAQLEPLVEGDITTVYDINESGVAVGDSEFLPVLWEADGDVVGLPLPQGYVAGIAVALNDQSQIVGAVFDDEGNERAVYWSGGTPTLLGANDVLVAIGAGGVMLGFDVSAYDPETDCCISTFVHAISGQRVTLPPSTGWLVFPSALTNNGVVVGTAFNDTTAVGIGWYQQYVFPIGGTGSAFLQPMDVIGAPAVLAVRDDGAGASSVLVNRTGQVFPLAHPSPIDFAVDLNDHGVAVGAGGSSFDEAPEVGRLYAYGSAISLDSLVDPASHASYDLHDPIALNNAFWIVGNSQDGSSWLLRPASGLPSTGFAAASVHTPDHEPAPGHRGERPLPVEPELGWQTAHATP